MGPVNKHVLLSFPNKEANKNMRNLNKVYMLYRPSLKRDLCITRPISKQFEYLLYGKLRERAR